MWSDLASAGAGKPKPKPKPDEDEGHVNPIFHNLLAAALGKNASLGIVLIPNKVPDSPEGFLMLWKSVCYAATKELFNKAWVCILEDFTQQEAVVSYILETYLPL